MQCGDRSLFDSCVERFQTLESETDLDGFVPVQVLNNLVCRLFQTLFLSYFQIHSQELAFVSDYREEDLFRFEEDYAFEDPSTYFPQTKFSCCSSEESALTGLAAPVITDLDDYTPDIIIQATTQPYSMQCQETVEFKKPKIYASFYALMHEVEESPELPALYRESKCMLTLAVWNCYKGIVEGMTEEVDFIL